MASNRPTFGPYGPKISARKSAPDEKTAGGIILPDVAQQDKDYGVVVAANPPRPDEPWYPALKPGDWVCWQKYVGSDIHDGSDDPKAMLTLLDYHEVQGWYRPETVPA